MLRHWRVQVPIRPMFRHWPVPCSNHLTLDKSPLFFPRAVAFFPALWSVHNSCGESEKTDGDNEGSATLAQTWNAYCRGRLRSLSAYATPFHLRSQSSWQRMTKLRFQYPLLEKIYAGREATCWPSPVESSAVALEPERLPCNPELEAGGRVDQRPSVRATRRLLSFDVLSLDSCTAGPIA